MKTCFNKTLIQKKINDFWNPTFHIIFNSTVEFILNNQSYVNKFNKNNFTKNRNNHNHKNWTNYVQILGFFEQISEKIKKSVFLNFLTTQVLEILPYPNYNFLEKSYKNQSKKKYLSAFST